MFSRAEQAGQSRDAVRAETQKHMIVGPVRQEAKDDCAGSRQLSD
jgi:hypothetical protein